MVPTDNQQGELFEVEHGLRKVGQLVFIQEEALQLFQPVEEKPGLRTGSTGNYRDLRHSGREILLGSSLQNVCNHKLSLHISTEL